jgi:hypothetical protein
MIHFSRSPFPAIRLLTLAKDVIGAIFDMTARGGNLLKETPLRTPMSGRPYLAGRLLATPGSQLRL